MDALALLCTLHADGPATLRRLRSLGCGDIRQFANRDALVIADDLEIEPAAARRLLREARILAERIGDAVLEAEEAPSVPTRTVPQPPRPALADAEPARGDSAGLDEGDRDLVARIIAGGGAEAEVEAPPMSESMSESMSGLVPESEVCSPAPEPAHVAEIAPEPILRQAFVPTPVSEVTEVTVGTGVAVEPAAEFALEPEPEPELAAAAFETEPAAEPAAESTAEPEPLGALTAGCLPGLDEIMLEDLQAAGIQTLAELGGAESLNLTRNLGVTFAQARRLRFLARRAASELPVAAVTIAAPAGPPAVVPAAETTLTPLAAPAPIPTAAAPSVRGTEPPVEVKVAAPTLTPAPVSAPKPGPVAEPVVEPPIEGEPVPAPEPRRPFWEPRGFLTEDAQPTPEPQGVRVDPSEIEARPRFGDQFARAARESKAQQAGGPDGRTVLGWNFEIPRPEEDALPLKALGEGIEAVQVDGQGSADPAGASTRSSSKVQPALDGADGPSPGEAAGPFA